MNKPPAIKADDWTPYLDAGLTLIPLHAWNARTKDKNGKAREAGKRPRDFNWTKRTYDSKAVAKVCAGNGTNAGVRLAASWLAIDHDPRRDPGDEWAAFCIEFGIDEKAYPLVRTGSGGRHLYARLPAGVRVVDTIDQFKSIEFKSAGRQVVAAGSRHPNGKLYAWAQGHPALADAPEAPAALLEAIRRPEPAGEATGGGQYDQEQLARALAKLNPEAFQDHDKWLPLMMACHHATAGDGRSEFIEWSTSDPKYAGDSEVIGRRWDSLHGEKAGAITVRTLNAILSDHGAANEIVAGDAAADFEAVEAGDDPEEPSENEWLEGGTESGSTELVRVETRGLKVNSRSNIAPDTFANALAAVVKSGLDPAWDELKQNVVFRADPLPWNESYGRILNDHVGRLARMFLLNEFQGVDYQPGIDHLFNALAGIAYAYKFNPVLEYLNSLKWDGVARVENLFPVYFNCGDDAYTRAVSRCFMIAAARRMRKPGSKFDTMAVMRSPQGWNKSTAIKTLFGADWYSDADLGNLRDKDSAMKLRGIWVQEFAEMESLTRNETGALKAFCSRATDRQRDPYGRVVEDAPRRCVFIATVNEGGYLKDSTGGRRFWPMEVNAPIGLARLAADRDQLWAEAAALEAQGISDVLPAHLWPIAAERQADQTSADPWADIVRGFLDRRAVTFDRLSASDTEDEDPLPPDRVHSSELFDELGLSAGEQTKDKAQRLRTVMEQSIRWHHRRVLRIGGVVRHGFARERPASKARPEV